MTTVTTPKKTKKLSFTAAQKEAKQFKGISVEKTKMNREKPFRVTLYYNKERHDLGYYENARSGALAYNRKAKELFGTEKNAKAAHRWNPLNS